ncbi:serine-rich adhesin for platelets [Magallana gigas]|uniref:serine-rich adhesin for platelets n=1 Tax=Magallana gigas TaxID=29159 RepID=UPI0033400607
MERLKTTRLSLPLVIFVLFVKSSLQQGFTPFGLRGFGRPPLFRGFGPPPPGLPRLLPPPLGLPGFLGAGPPLPIVSPPLTTLTEGGAGSFSLSGDTVPSTLDLSGFSGSVQTLPTGTGTSIAGQSGFGGDLFSLSDPTNSLNTQNLITTLTGGDALLGGSTSSLTNSLATGMITSDAGVPEGVDPASAAESSFVSRFSNGNINDGGSTTFTLPGQLNSFDSVPVSSSRSFDPTAILNSVFRSPGATPSTSTVTVGDNSPNQIIFTSGVSNNAAPSNLVQRQTMTAENTGERIPTINELQQMFTPTELSRNGGNTVIVSSADPRSGGNTRGSETRITNMNSVTTVNRVDDPRRSQASNPSDELNMEFRNFIRADGGQTDPNDILYRFPSSTSSLNTASSISSERMSLPSNSILGETADPRAGSRTTITEIRSNTNIGSDPLNSQMTSSFATDPRLVLDPATSSISSTRDTGPVNRPLSSVNSSENKSNVIINGNSNIVGSNVDMNRFIRNNEVQIPQTINLQRSDFENSVSNRRSRVESPISPVNSFNERFDVRADPLNARADPSNIRTDPLNFRTDPLNIRRDPSTLRTDPLDIRRDPSNLRTDPLDIRRDPSTLRTDPLDIRRDPSTVRTDPLDIRRDPLDIRTDPWDIRRDPSTVRTDPLDIRTDPWDIRRDPSTVRTDPLDIRRDPSTVRTDPLDIRTDPWDIRRDPSTVRTDPLNVRSDTLNVRTDPLNDSLRTQQTTRSQDPGNDPQRGSKIVFVDGQNTEDDRGATRGVVFPANEIAANTRMATDAGNSDTQPRVNINFNFPANQLAFNTNRPTVSSNSSGGVDPLTASQQVPDIRLFQRPSELWGSEAGASDPGRPRMVDSRTGSLPTASMVQRFETTNQVPRGNSNGDDPSIFQQTDPNRGNGGMTLQDATINMQPSSFQRFQSTDGIPRTNADVLDPNNFGTMGSNRARGGTTSQNDPGSTMQRFTTTNQATGGNDEETDPRITGNVRDPNSNRMDSQTAQSGFNVRNPEVSVNPQPSVAPTTRRFIKKTTTIRRFIVDPNENQTANSSQTATAQGSDPNASLFARMNFGFSNINTSSNTNTGASTNMADTSGMPRIMGNQNSLQTSRFSQSVLPGNIGGTNSFVNAADSTNNENRQPIRTRFATASDPQSQSSRTIAGQAPNSIAMDPSFASNMDPSVNQDTINRFVSTSNMADSGRTPQIMGVQNSLQTSRFSQSVLPGNTGNIGGSNSFVTTRGFNNDEDGRPSMTRFVTSSDPQSQGTGTRQTSNSISTNSAISPSSIETRFAPSSTGNLFRSLPSVEGSGFTNSGFPSASGQNIGIGGFVSTNAGGSPGTQNSESSIFERFGGTSAGSGFQTLRSTGDNFAVRSRQASNSSVVRNSAGSRNGNSNDVTIIETSRRNVVLSSENPGGNPGGERNGEVARGSTLPPIVPVNDTQSCLSIGCPTGEQCTFNQNFLCPEWAEASACQCRQGCQAYNRFIPLGTRLSVDTCGNVCVCNNNDGIADCTQTPCN